MNAFMTSSLTISCALRHSRRPLSSASSPFSLVLFAQSAAPQGGALIRYSPRSLVSSFSQDREMLLMQHCVSVLSLFWRYYQQHQHQQQQRMPWKQLEAELRQVLDEIKTKNTLKKTHFESLSKELFNSIDKRSKRFFSRGGKSALRKYTTDKGYVWNEALRNGGSKNEKESHLIQTTCKVLTNSNNNNMTQVHQGLVYRGCKALPPALAESLVPGATFCDPAFMSTTTSDQITREFMGGSSSENQDGRLLFRIESKTGVDISRVSTKKHEAEVLFLPGTLFRIRSVKKGVKRPDRGVFTEVVMEEIAAFSW